jgi:hypothetical protein
MLYGAKVAICSEINAKHNNTLRQNVKFLNAKPVGASRNQRAVIKVQVLVHIDLPLLSDLTASQIEVPNTHNRIIDTHNRIIDPSARTPPPSPVLLFPVRLYQTTLHHILQVFSTMAIQMSKI